MIDQLPKPGSSAHLRCFYTPIVAFTVFDASGILGLGPVVPFIVLPFEVAASQPTIANSTSLFTESSFAELLCNCF